MSKVLIENSTLTNIAEAIRNQSGINSQMLPSEMPEHILNIDTEKVTVNGKKVNENLNLFIEQYTKEFGIKKAPTKVRSILNERRFSSLSEDVIKFPRLYYSYEISTTSTQITFSKPLEIVKTNGELKTITLPTINIPSTSEYPTGSGASNGVQGAIIQNHLQDYYLICLRSYIKNKNSTNKKNGNGYITIFKLDLDNNYNASWVQKCHEVRLFETDSVYDSPEFTSIDFLNGKNYSAYIDDNEAIIFGNSGKTSDYDTCVYHINFNNSSCITIDTNSIVGKHYSTSPGFTIKNQNTICLYQKDEEDNIGKFIKIDANTNTIIDFNNASDFYTNNPSLIKQNFIYNNKLYFNGRNGTNIYYIYEFDPITYEAIKLIEINDVQSVCFLLNHTPLSLCTSEFYYHFNLENISFQGPYFLPEIPSMPKEWVHLQGQLGVGYVVYNTRYFFLPQYNCLLAFSEATGDGGDFVIYLYKVYIRFLDNKPLTYTTLQL